MHIYKTKLKTMRSHLACMLEPKDFDREVRMRHTLREYKFNTRKKQNYDRKR